MKLIFGQNYGDPEFLRFASGKCAASRQWRPVGEPERKRGARSGAPSFRNGSDQFPVALETSIVTPGPIVELTAIFFM